ncbi:hypothetical protein AB0A74_25605 [Saccharothrix sp. NPDC042600]|uniref:hypothetical protein n=1 Tax=Saccharothrix TaxID=2071 RepID=UPI0033E0FC00
MKKALVAIGLFGLVGCTAAPAPTPAVTTTSAPTATRTQAVGDLDCAKAPEEVVGAALQLNLAHPKQTVNQNVVVCQYEGGGVNTMVRFQTETDADAFAQGKKGFTDSGQRVTDLGGFFDEAYTSTLGAGEVVQNTLVARKGDTEILVTSAANFEQEKKLVTELFGRL